MATTTLRPMQSDEVEELVRITAATGFFRPEEVVVTREVLTECASKGEASGYQTWVAANSDVSGRTLGYVCFGQTPLTRGTWDIYWIAVDPSQQRQGIGQLLMHHAEEEIGRQGGRLVLVETSAQEMYRPTLSFYSALKYQEVSCIPDFYDLGDAKVTFAKSLVPGGARTMSP
ncbi:MAG: N-acetyltransferase [Dehalococcoidia bacterium]|nr:N-acetyltransferase [Dehalococcoidia bacterium]